MKNDPKAKHHEEAIEATAAAWLAQKDDGLTPTEEAEFLRWRQAHPRHEAAVARLETAWQALQQLRDFRPSAHTHPDSNLLVHSHPRFRNRPWLAAAAALVLLGGSVLLWRIQNATEASRAPVWLHYATTIDGYQRITLKDGSVLELNSNSEANVRLTPGRREVELKRGEAYFTVAKDAARPFFVEVGAIAVRAVGTAFNVRRSEAEVEVLVTEGRVQVDRAAQMIAGPNPTVAPETSPPHESGISSAALVAAGQRALVSVRAPNPVREVEEASPESIRNDLAWQGSRLVFVNSTLAEVAVQFNLRNRVQLVLGDDELKAMTVGGSFRADNVDAFVRLLASDREIRIERPNDEQIVLRRAR